MFTRFRTTPCPPTRCCNQRRMGTKGKGYEEKVRGKTSTRGPRSFVSPSAMLEPNGHPWLLRSLASDDSENSNNSDSYKNNKQQQQCTKATAATRLK